MTALKPEAAELIRVRVLVQGVGFRPTVWRLASRYGLPASRPARTQKLAAAVTTSQKP
jgi:hydrogenase maturation factor HypF (carbamoyltransferase family)